MQILVDEDLASKIGRPPSTVQEMERVKVDFIVSIGGDGTILRTIHKMADPAPILGINMGTLGFLVDVVPADAAETIKRLLSGFVVDERSRLKLLINGVCMPQATNEIAFITASPAKMIEFEILVDGSLMEDFRADGVIIATATGSTAYAMSAGGPIVDPRVDAIVLVPMAPFKLSSRPWVMPGNSVIEVRLKLPEKEALVVVDGQETDEHIHQRFNSDKQGQDPGQVCEGGKGRLLRQGEKQAGLGNRTGYGLSRSCLMPLMQYLTPYLMPPAFIPPLF